MYIDETSQRNIGDHLVVEFCWQKNLFVLPAYSVKTGVLAVGETVPVALPFLLLLLVCIQARSWSPLPLQLAVCFLTFVLHACAATSYHPCL